MPFTKNIHSADWTEERSSRNEMWKYLDISGEKLGARIEELQSGESSSVHHFHTSEEEHVLVMEGEATLMLGSDQCKITAGDHYWFPAGVEEAHHIENTSTAPFRFLVFGERCPSDVVVYPEHQVMLVKGLGSRQFTYRPLKKSDAKVDEDI